MTGICVTSIAGDRDTICDVNEATAAGHGQQRAHKNYNARALCLSGPCTNSRVVQLLKHHSLSPKITYKNS